MKFGSSRQLSSHFTRCGGFGGQARQKGPLAAPWLCPEPGFGIVPVPVPLSQDVGPAPRYCLHPPWLFLARICQAAARLRDLFTPRRRGKRGSSGTNWTFRDFFPALSFAVIWLLPQSARSWSFFWSLSEHPLGLWPMFYTSFM